MINKQFKFHHSFLNKRQNSFTITVYDITHMGKSNIKEKVYTITSFDNEVIVISKNYKNTMYYDTKHFFLKKNLPPRETLLLISRMLRI